MYIIDAVGINLDTGIQGTGCLGEVDGFTIIMRCEFVHVFNQFYIPRIASIDPILRIHPNGTLVQFSQLFLLSTC